MFRCSPGRCPSNRHCHNPRKRNRGRWFPGDTYPGRGRYREPRKCRWPWRKFLQTRARRLRYWLRRTEVGARLDQCRPRRRSSSAFAGCGVSKSSFCERVDPFSAFYFLVSIGLGLLLLWSATLLLLGQFLLKRHFTHGVLLAAGARIGHGKLVVAGRVFGHNLHVFSQWSQSFRETLCRIQRDTQGEIGLSKTGIEFGGLCEARDGLVPLADLPRQFAQEKHRGGVRWVNAQLRLKFLLPFFGRSRSLRPRQGYARQAVMNAGKLGILLQDAMVLGGGFVPFIVRFQGFRFQFVSLIGGGRHRSHSLGCFIGKLGIIVSGDV